ncbi:MAG TPA: hypothetical protein VGL47_30425 [Amycolatopsis sp.]|uniref:Secreted protein n=1 Tax=Amycolatopsis nalaikhensis TaxID=715472 RepID=A0ABY8XR37_9PSEU|nr:hypothetical protein [Amycolatopsis sp. 2-2]WIV58101.1 hypothetical protein QP939_05380 [Amycolatopsis sp. 2-2]
MNAPTRTSSSPVLLWLVLVLGAGVNAAGSLTGLPDPIRITAGAIATIALVALIVHYVRRRR